MDVGLYRLRDDAPVPAYQTAGAVAFDLTVPEGVRIAPHRIALVPTGIVVALPPGWSLAISLRSSVPATFGVLQPHGVGLIDRDYCGQDDEIGLQLLNFTSSPADIPANTRLAKGTLLKSGQANWIPFVPRRESRGGFGTTGHS